MDEQITEQIKRLKEELLKEKAAVAEIGELVGEQIDRPFHVDPWELSEKELDSEMADILPFLNDDIDPRQGKEVITSHRGLLGKPLVFLKRKFLDMFEFYTSFLQDKQRRFNDRLVRYQLSSFIRFRRNEKHLYDIREKLKEIEENQELIFDQLREIRKAAGTTQDNGGEHSRS